MAAAAAATSLLIRHNRNPHLLLLRAAISSSRALSQQPELSPDPTTGAPDPAGAAPLPPNPSTGSPLYSQNWRNPAAANPPSSLLPTVAAGSSFGAQHRMAAFYDKPDAAGLKETFAKYMAEQRWEDMKLLFDHWVRSLDAATGKPNHPDVDLFNHYLRANLMTGAKRAPTPETYLAKIYAHSSIGQLQRAFGTLHEFENAYGNSKDVDLELFSPFTSLHPLVVACCKDGFSTLDLVYVQLENLSHADPPYKSVAALNCVILGCANIWDINRAYETFVAIKEKFELSPDIHSYNALLCAFGKLKQTGEACNVFQHVLTLGVKPNATTYSRLVDAHLANKDPKAALAIIDEMVQVDAGFTPSKDTLRKVRRRCSRESDFDSDEKVQSLAKQFNYRMGGSFY
ncbi:Pentatricopeptide repeat-containing protein mitochondrial [Zea mays]|uniref:Pentatricopeptide repeat-containing protein mitochondrial n=1 Tax=Zea mays TaxID=4577 RepID=A0A1D6IIY3_MAIZE|nr:Pentatricopeptide repeat-containing protein mitochondrial [Zea mays]